MKKVRALQILVYIVFGLFVFQNMAADFWQGVKDGYNDGMGTIDGAKRYGPTLQATIDGSFISQKNGGEMKIGENYTLKNIIINSDIVVNNDNISVSWPLNAIETGLILITTLIVIRIAYLINKVIVNIVEGTLFEQRCIKLIKSTGMLLLLFTLTDYIGQQVFYQVLIAKLHVPLKIINTSAFNFGTLVFAILIFILAEAFKQGARLKEEQALTI
ncbi:DUF2975 domain-containing protein [Mucilaginibacter gossypii]|uniref:DUF2975 domain-containing protein n=1 Tax=Mucilaginibacter gossypii TaxID=551996 RepID=UPI000DCE564C|nr:MULTISPECIES: DUF2975 domain-containing protein [Mucilaginibacter]QTE37369.1 DUF2975 domain-containing protein [Mucilaginibacter gossypii]RAV57320.1 hypothetical protein DIU36_13520 [Mucilaginibacter rubeus]